MLDKISLLFKNETEKMKRTTTSERLRSQLSKFDKTFFALYTQLCTKVGVERVETDVSSAIGAPASQQIRAEHSRGK